MTLILNMMSLEGENSQEARILTSTDSMKSDNGRQAYDYRSAMAGTTLSGEMHPLALSEADLSSTEAKDPYETSHEDSGTNNKRVEIGVEPPSYADAVFSPYMGGRGSAHDAGGSSVSSSASNGSSEFMTITVTHPQKEQENGSSLVPGGNTFFSYLIVSRTNMQGYGGTDFTVRRRFREVVALADRLTEAFKGYFIPPRPDKSIVESQVRQKKEFIEQRRVSLEKYLGRLANHPIIRRSNELKLFLQYQGELPYIPSIDMASMMLDEAAQLPRQISGKNSAILAPQEVSQPAKGGKDIVRLFKEIKQSFANDWGNVKPAIVEEDKEFLEKKEKLQDLEQELNEASQQAELLVKAQEDDGEVMGELGLALIKLAKFEIEEATVSAQNAHALDVKQIATAAVKASRFSREANAQSVNHLDQLHEYLGLMQAVRAAFSERSNALLTLQTVVSDLNSTNNRVEKLSITSSKVFGGDKSRNRKIEELKESIKAIEDSRELAQKEYDQIKDRNRAELKRFESERQRDFLHMLNGFVHTQVGYAERIANVWKKVAEETNENARKYLESPTSSSVTIG